MTRHVKPYWNSFVLPVFFFFFRMCPCHQSSNTIVYSFPSWHYLLLNTNSFFSPKKPHFGFHVKIIFVKTLNILHILPSVFDDLPNKSQVYIPVYIILKEILRQINKNIKEITWKLHKRHRANFILEGVQSATVHLKLW